MLTEIYIEALLVDSELADQVFAERSARMPRWMRPAVALAILFLAIVLADAIGLTSLVSQGCGTISWGFLLVYVLRMLTYGLWLLLRGSRVQRQQEDS